MSLKEIFENEKIECFGVISFDVCRVVRPYLTERCGITPKSVIAIAVPYYTGEGRRLSAYAVSRDYHRYMSDMLSRVCDALKAEYTEYSFFGFADRSPIDERDACVRAGLGVIGDNGLLLTEKYSSYVFLAEIISDADPEVLGGALDFGIRCCEHCGECTRACPMHTEGCECISYISQKKGELAERERELLIKYDTVWGCDICQRVCPHTKSAIEGGSITTPIAFFHTERIESLSREIITEMSDEKFLERAFSWRGRDTLLRNIDLFEKKPDNT